MVTYNCNTLLSLFLKKTPNIEGIQYLALGAGDNSWDIAMPSIDPSIKRLKKEISRLAIKPESVFFLDNSNKQADVPTHKIEIRCSIKGSDINPNEHVILREFGLFGGNATEAANSGFLVNYVIHPKIELSPDDVITRKIRLSFNVSSYPFGMDLSVETIDGIGEKYRKELNSAGISKIGDLISLNTHEPIGNIPKVKLQEFCTKAKLLLIGIDLTPYSVLAEYSISAILSKKPSQIVKGITSQNITEDDIKILQDGLAIFQVALDEEKLVKLTLMELMNK